METETQRDGDVPAEEREAIGLAPDAPESFPFSPAVRWRDLLFVSGHAAFDAGNTIVAGGIVEQTEQTLTNLATTLDQAGSGLDRLLKCNVFLADLDDWAAMTEVWVRRIGLPRPARCAVGVQLPEGMLIEVDAIAAAGR